MSDPTDLPEPLESILDGAPEDGTPQVDPAELQTDEPAPPPEPEPAAQAAPEPPAAPAAAKKEGESWQETVKTVVYALLIALVIRTFLFQPFNIPSASMEATLLVGDYLFVEKFAYGYSSHSFPYSVAPFSGRVFGRQPTPGDVIVFKMPNPTSDHYMDDYIKRLIGMPGDHIQMKGSVVILNGKPIPRVRVADYDEVNPFGITEHITQFRETLPNGKSYLVLDRGGTDLGQKTASGEPRVFVVPPGHYFMMGDNRDNSDDSRGQVGYVPFDDLVGRAELRFFSIDDSAIWYEPWTWPGAIRFSRMFTFID